VGTREALCGLLQSAPCMVTELNLSGCGGMAGIEIGSGLLVAPGAALACVRLRVLNLARLKLSGPIPPELGSCVWLRVLELQDNMLRGSLPEELGACTRLETLATHKNQLSGKLPVEALLGMRQLGTLSLGGEAGGNEELSITSTGKLQIEEALGEQAYLYLPKVKDESKALPPPKTAPAAPVACKATPPGVVKDPPPGVTAGPPPGVISSGGPPGVINGDPPGVVSGGPPGVVSGGPPGVVSGEPPGVVSGGAPGVVSGGAPGVVSGDPPGVVSGGTGAETAAAKELQEEPKPVQPRPKANDVKKVKMKSAAPSAGAGTFVDPMEVRAMMAMEKAAQEGGEEDDADDDEETPPASTFIDPLEKKKAAPAVSGGWGASDANAGPASPPPRRKVKTATKWPPDPEPEDE
jgi:hypothetical protein